MTATATKGGMLPQAARDLAQKWAERGVPALPIGLSWNHTGRSIDKDPLSSAIAKNGFYDASNDPQRAEELFLRTKLGPRQEWGVGVYPGPAGYIVLDIDVKNDGTGPEDLDRLIDELGPLPTAMKVTTASGGFHLWLRRPAKPDHIGNVKIAAGIDIRCDAGYVVAPGTTSPWGSWTRDADSPRLDEVGELPAAWAERLYARREDGTREPISETLTAGSRYPSLLRLSGAMRRQGATSEEIFAALRIMNERRCVPPHEDSVLRKLAEDIATRYPPEPDPVDPFITPPTEPSTEPSTFTGGSLADLLGKELQPIRWTVDRLLPEGLSLLAGKPKLGKSWLALMLALMVAAGHKFLDYHVDAGMVLYIALEDGERRMQNRTKWLGARNLPHMDRFHPVYEWPTLDRGGVERLEQWMREYPQTRLIVIDTYGRIRGDVAGKDRYAEEYALLGGLQRFAIQHGVALLLIHHLRKQGADDWLEQLSGSQAVTGAADTLLGLYRERGQMDATLRLVSRDADEFDLALKFNDGRWESMGDASHYRLSTERTAILEALESLGGVGSVAEIAELVEKTGPNTSKMLVGLYKDGLVKRPKRGTYSLSTTVDSVDSVDTEPLESTESTQTTNTYDLEEFDFEAGSAWNGKRP